ncbi:GNAT family N-acetyltransferase [Tetragenococcus koreensis]|uniref:Acetyltransferase n=1 Tax=Tetragenococcus koreensis TaxID=290335 RepID=A0AAN4RIN1_9ENTE|nr:GNAT family protein [Tetragenococcus koreensis]AYW46197.1 GNAT family N-acetyltransferase [Tetragenococcus koreensis]MCF1584938.1 GNAT family N-acetyltransferase [Tetragenococcus koreensis]MCF1614451.1 GNAT family N-acetyltransferase [Tetragenococcus koreensis]MCF1617239.1 GNAT family N-acetyltransferase [Tetragenococcus koreensis]MCF1619854.1 GNAT family N-acetyltransferase [Tetragenococcus koreensis]
MQGQKVYLAELREGDAQHFAEQQWDKMFIEGLSEDVFHPFQAADWQKMFGDASSNEQFNFTIRNVADDGLIGFVSLNDVLLKNRRAELGIGILSAKNRGKGYGKEALDLLLEFAFNHLGLHKVNLSVHAYNKGAITLYEKLGFVKEGTNRKAIFKDGFWMDQYNYGLLADEWRNK